MGVFLISAESDDLGEVRERPKLTIALLPTYTYSTNGSYTPHPGNLRIIPGENPSSKICFHINKL